MGARQDGSLGKGAFVEGLIRSYIRTYRQIMGAGEEGTFSSVV